MTNKGKFIALHKSSPLHNAMQVVSSREYDIYDFIPIVDSDSILLGVLNSNDIINGILTAKSMDLPVDTFMTKNPIFVRDTLSAPSILSEVSSAVVQRTHGKKKYVRYVPVVDSNNRLVDVIDVYRLVESSAISSCTISIYGLGFVGLTLSVAMANKGHRVFGIDSNMEIVQNLSKGISHIYEPRLEEMLSNSLDSQTLTIHSSDININSNILIISVGTPIAADGSTCLDSLVAVSESIAKVLKKGDLVLLRSTVPVGTTRSVVIPLLQQISGLNVGSDFNIAFTPERTVEGNAIKELTSLPQIVGGFTPKCTELAAKFWRNLTENVILLDSLESAELVKLLNNSFRDLSFSFANSFALLADKYNIDSFKVIQAANEGYPRNPIPIPSPGVGGYCLTKDPLLYSSVDPTLPHAILSKAGRSANEIAAEYPYRVVKRFFSRRNISATNSSVLIIGIAFKGQPATNDIRGSSSLVVIKKLLNDGVKVYGFDSVVPESTLLTLDIIPVTHLSVLPSVQAVLILNNHVDNVPEGLLSNLKPHTLVFDGWNMLEAFEVESYPELYYATMGYMSPNA